MSAEADNAANRLYLSQVTGLNGFKARGITDAMVGMNRRIDSIGMVGPQRAR